MAHQLRLAGAALALRGSDSRHGIHEGRKAVRRARAALLLGWEHPNAAVALALEQLKWTNGQLSDLRDAHALVGAVKRLAGGARGQAFEAVDRARKGLKRRRAGLEGDPASQARVGEALERIEFIAAGAAALPWNDAVRPGIRATVAATRVQVARAQRSALAHPSPKRLHKWRRRLRRLLQQHEACVALGIDVSGDNFLECIAEQLGKLQDYNVLLDRVPCIAGLHGNQERRFRQAVREARNEQRERLVSVVLGD